MSQIRSLDVRLRENRETQRIAVYDKDRLVFSHREYRGVIEWMKIQYPSITHRDYEWLYLDYKEDCDREE